MDNFIMEATKSTPSVRLDAVSNVLEIKGESYPENASKFYSPVFEWLDKYLAGLQGQDVKVNFTISYFNSSTSKILMNMLDMLQEAHKAGKTISINWFFAAENELARECGEEFREDLEDLPFNLLEIAT